MLGQKDFKPCLFHTVQLEDLVPKDHELRRILGLVDFATIRYRVKDKYSHTGQPGVDPAVIIKMLFLGYYYGVNSERKLAKDIVINVAYRWFLGYDLDEETPTHSVLSKARTRFGLEAFQNIFDEIVEQCIKAGLVSGKQAFIDATLIEANASEEKLLPRIQIMTPKEYTTHMMPEEKEEHQENSPDQRGPSSKNLNDRLVSPTDPDASFIGRGKKEGLNYEGHYVVDGKNKVIVAVDTTDTVDNASKAAPDMLQKAFFRHGLKFESVCADAEYGTQGFYHFLLSQGMVPYIPAMETGGNDKSLFTKSAFIYQQETDTYQCPAGHVLKRGGESRREKLLYYHANRKECQGCALREQCTKSANGRGIKRLFFEDDVAKARALAETPEYKEHMRLRRITVEPLFSEAKGCHGLSRAKYRRRWRVGIQVLWTATVQNIKRLLKESIRPPRLVIQASAAQMDNQLQFIFLKLLSLLNYQRTLCCS